MSAMRAESSCCIAVVVVPVPFEATVSFRTGTKLGPAAIAAASRQVDLLDADFGRVYGPGLAMEEAAPWIATSSDDARLEFIAERVLARPLAADEMTIVKKSLADLADWYKAHPDDAKTLIGVGDTKPRAADPVQLASWTMLTNELMNLDEVLCK